MGMTVDEFRGGSDANGGTVLQGGDTHVLIPEQRWCLFSCSGGTGSVSLRLPNALGLPNGLVFHIQFISSSQDTVIETNDGLVQAVYDITGTTQNSIDFASGKWGTTVGIEVRLLANNSQTGSWVAYLWSQTS